jgi:hypothetical protein
MSGIHFYRRAIRDFATAEEIMTAKNSIEYDPRET